MKASELIEKLQKHVNAGDDLEVLTRSVLRPRTASDARVTERHRVAGPQPAPQSRGRRRGDAGAAGFSEDRRLR